jgi:hypothetical protein
MYVLQKRNNSCVGYFDYSVKHDDGNTSLLPATDLRKSQGRQIVEHKSARILSIPIFYTNNATLCLLHRPRASFFEGLCHALLTSGLHTIPYVAFIIYSTCNGEQQCWFHIFAGSCSGAPSAV